MFPEAITIDKIKATVPVTYVLHVRGYAPVEAKGRDLMYLTPWRQDSNPSLACYPTNDGGVVDRWRDMARAEGGDIVDLIGALDPTLDTYGQRLDLATRLYHSYLETDWVAPKPAGRRGTFDLEAAKAEMLTWGDDEQLGLLGTWLHEREDYVANIPEAWLRQHFGVTWVDGEIKAPYGDDGLYKYRKPGEKFKSPAGTSGMWTFFYGEQHDDGVRPVVLCEGEPDVWSGTHSTQDYVFLGLPSGAGTRPEKMASRLSGRRVLLAFDRDAAGRDAFNLWSAELAGENQVEVVPIPEGRDLSEVADIPRLLAQARPYTRPLRGLIALDGRYRRVSNNGNPGPEVSDFLLQPERVLFSTEGGLSYEVNDGRQQYLLLSSDLRNKNSLQRWAHDKGLVWSGSDTDVAVLTSMLKADSIFCPVEGAADVAGVYDRHIVWDGGSIGDRPVRFVPGNLHIKYDINLTKGEGRPDLRIIQAMRSMNDRAVVDPILAWTAASVFRSYLPQFPILNVSGTAGSGKTTTVRAIIPTLTGSNIFKTLSSTTPFAVEAVIHNTNAFPVVFDEYRAGGRDESLRKLEQLARDAYNGQPSAKSAGGDRWNEVVEIRTMAPIVIAGEQSFEEKSHAERMVFVNVPRPVERNDKHLRALKFVQASQDGTLAHAFMSWAVRAMQEDDMPVEIPSAPDRMSYNLAVLDLGWRILNDFLAAHGAGQLDDPDWSGMVQAQEELAATNPTLEALAWALGDEYASRNVWIKDDDLMVSAVGLVADVKRNGVIVLPGNNARTLSNQLQQDYGATQHTRLPPFGGNRKKVWVMSVNRVFPDGVD